jgi:predicted enzyme related to lactoylglutathione lyase
MSRARVIVLSVLEQGRGIEIGSIGQRAHGAGLNTLEVMAQTDWERDLEITLCNKNSPFSRSTMTIQLVCVTFDCRDALLVGQFWSTALGRPLDPDSTAEFSSIGFAERRDRDGWHPVERRDDPTWIFAHVPESKAVKNRVHPDLIAEDVESEIARLEHAGATRVADREEYGYRWTLMTDPEGNEFDLARAL